MVEEGDREGFEGGHRDGVRGGGIDAGTEEDRGGDASGGEESASLTLQLGLIN